MKKNWLTFFPLTLGFFLSVVSVSAQKNNTKQANNSLLWKISKEGISQPSYLFGTIHLICKQDYFWTDKMQNSLDNTAQVCLEMNIDDPQMATEAASMMMDLSGTVLRDYFKNDEDYNLVARYIEDSLGQNIQLIERMKPIALLMLYSSGLIKSPCAETVSYEYKLIEKAKSKNNEVLGLESLQNQFEFLESIPSDSIINQMIRIAKGEDSNKDETALLIDAYKHQNLTALDFLINKAGAEGLIDNKVFIENRNKNWAKAMASIMTQKPTFFAVGAGHLHGLIDLLKSAGFKVEPIK